ncbi:MAG: hypothetical protein IPL19_29630 [Sandaracinaceae bacterium]|jgi:transposase-like protein|nr:hypothetical protein [Sandaracinaceae bacterium]MBK8412120.1 hypothetical protein [Sandaracinaceae bacterium]
MGIKKTELEFLAGLKGPRHWSEEDARRALALQEASGESRAGFARRHGLRATRLAWWQARLSEWEAEDAPSPSPASAWVELLPRDVVRASPSVSRALPAPARVRVGGIELELSVLDTTAAHFVVELAERMGLR